MNLSWLLDGSFSVCRVFVDDSANSCWFLLEYDASVDVGCEF